MKLFNAIPLKYRVMIFAVAAVLIFGAGYVKGRFDKDIKTANKQTAAQTERADNAEKQRDIANAAPASVDDMVEWLQRGGGPK